MAVKKFIITMEVEVEESSVEYIQESINEGMDFDMEKNEGIISLYVSKGVCTHRDTYVAVNHPASGQKIVKCRDCGVTV